MPTYTVELVQASKSFKTKAGHDLVSYTVALKGPDGLGELAQRNMKPDSPPPKPGDVWDCTLEPNGDFPKKVKMEQKASFGGGGSRSNPEDMRQRAAQGALSNAVAFSSYLQSIDKRAPTNSQELLTLADSLYGWLRQKAEGK